LLKLFSNACVMLHSCSAGMLYGLDSFTVGMFTFWDTWDFVISKHEFSFLQYYIRSIYILQLTQLYWVKFIIFASRVWSSDFFGEPSHIGARLVKPWVGSAYLHHKHYPCFQPHICPNIFDVVLKIMWCSAMDKERVGVRRQRRGQLEVWKKGLNTSNSILVVMNLQRQNGKICIILFRHKFKKKQTKQMLSW
jgi:hypothetical protein